MDKMASTLDMPGQIRISGTIIATGVSYDTFINGYEGQRVEWVNGAVIAMASIDERHDALINFSRVLFTAYLEHTGGRIVGDPMIMRLITVPSSRAPDIQILLPDRLHQLQKNEVVGPANLVIEIVSPGNSRTDYVDKRREYELGGVPEYWILNHQKPEALFLQLNEMGLYVEVPPDAEGVYHSAALPHFKLPVALLWRESLPGYREVGQLVEAMFA